MSQFRHDRASRRAFLKASVLSAAALPLIGPLEAQVNEPDASYADPEASERWMTDWQSWRTRTSLADTGRDVVGPLVLTRFADPMYIVMQPITWSPNASQRGAYKAVTVPVRFVTDFASIPRLFWSGLKPDGNYCYAAVIHDYLYWEQQVSRNTADDIFAFAMADFRVNRVTIAAIKTAVQLGGGPAWESNARLKAGGEKRVLKRLPEDPTTRWADWKKRSDVF
jgi:hypothetical protein